MCVDKEFENRKCAYISDVNVSLGMCCCCCCSAFIEVPSWKLETERQSSYTSMRVFLFYSCCAFGAAEQVLALEFEFEFEFEFESAHEELRCQRDTQNL